MGKIQKNLLLWPIIHTRTIKMPHPNVKFLLDKSEKSQLDSFLDS